MLVFNDVHGGRVELTFGANQNGMSARHVLVVLKHNGKWLLTQHLMRGVEFPGGKAESGETIEEAVVRETIEETGVTITDLVNFAEYIVRSNSTFCKAVFTGKVVEIDENPVLHETGGAIWMTSEELAQCEELSFLMKDTGMEALRGWVEAHEL
ncbi:NUDIX domain-containing protein [Sporosarcina sp. ANT_H38]|uniref:NUDIX domain-containing protein n=1 Tax=Sporosarcina sp. ANT_H38 TaxID=2597358 RepID=UPI0011F378ED|nr:NUDIX domain-containing protein [Sporosarcina sp. ANT_H38]KAA0964797.1 NUDIX domain-containing protein [Sporosarcina sp. ANT_H38]